MIEKRLTLSWGTIAYISHGEGPLLVFLHGGSITPRAYIPLFEQLGKHFTVIAPTHPGHGASFSPPKMWRMYEFVQFYEEFFKALHIEPTYLVGHSFGGGLALVLGSRGYGEKLIAMAPTALPFSLTPASYMKARRREAQDLLTYLNDIERVKETLSAAGLLLYTVIQRFDDIVWFAKWVSRTDIQKDLVQIHQPVRLLWGSDDGIVPMTIGKRILQIIPSATLTVMDGRGHTYPVTDPEFTYEQLMNALRT